jgi:ABC-type polysaccharide/polyol phosphate transport system ATPase subunit
LLPIQYFGQLRFFSFSVSPPYLVLELKIYGEDRSRERQATGDLIRREGKSKERIVVRALNDVFMTINEDDRLGIVGRNGPGKSILLKVLMR